MNLQIVKISKKDILSVILTSEKNDSDFIQKLIFCWGINLQNGVIF